LNPRQFIAGRANTSAALKRTSIALSRLLATFIPFVRLFMPLVLSQVKHITPLSVLTPRLNLNHCRENFPIK
jgi:hypothetical protein